MGSLFVDGILIVDKSHILNLAYPRRTAADHCDSRRLGDATSLARDDKFKPIAV